MAGYVWLVIIGIVALVFVAYLLGGRRGREILEGRALRRALALKARDIMTRPVVVVHEDATLEEAARTMLERDIRCLPVIGAGGALVGVITEYDVTGRRTSLVGARRATLVGERVRFQGLEGAYEEAAGRPVSEVMSTPVLTVGEDEPITDLALVMIERGVRHVPVVNEAGLLVGIISRHDLLRLIAHGCVPRRPRWTPGR